MDKKIETPGDFAARFEAKHGARCVLADRIRDRDLQIVRWAETRIRDAGGADIGAAAAPILDALVLLLKGCDHITGWMADKHGDPGDEITCGARVFFEDACLAHAAERYLMGDSYQPHEAAAFRELAAKLTPEERTTVGLLAEMRP